LGGLWGPLDPLQVALLSEVIEPATRDSDAPETDEEPDDPDQADME